MQRRGFPQALSSTIERLRREKGWGEDELVTSVRSSASLDKVRRLAFKNHRHLIFQNANRGRSGDPGTGLTTLGELFDHLTSGASTILVSIDLIDFEPKEQPPSLAQQLPDFVEDER